MYKEPRLYVYEQVVILVRYMYILIVLFYYTLDSLYARILL